MTMQSERDERTFPERVKRLNLAWLVSIEPAEMARLAQAVEEAINATGTRLVYVKSSSHRLFIDEDRRNAWDRDGE